VGLHPESYLQPNRGLVQVSLRIHFDFFDYASVLFLHPEVFTEHRMRPRWHGHREHTTGCPGGTVHAVGSSGSAMDSTRRGGELRQRRPWPSGAPCSGSGNGHWTGFGTELGSRRFGWVGRAGVTVDFGPLPYRN
jgi:hypothetical protein